MFMLLSEQAADDPRDPCTNMVPAGTMLVSRGLDSVCY